MRKIVTGEQIAQLTNPDPFAVPTWRAPVYRTPGWIITLVQLVRLLVWLARLIARHPLAATVVAVLVLAWLNIGWIGLVLLVAWAGAVLGTWRCFWPSSFTRWIAGPARGKWRGWWCYRRRWAGVMAISGVAPWHQGRNLFPDRIAMRLDEPEQVDMVLGDGARDRGAACELISTDPAIGAGVAFVRLETDPDPVRVRAGWVSDADIWVMAAQVQTPVLEKVPA